MDKIKDKKENREVCRKEGCSFCDFFILSLVSAGCGFIVGLLFAPGSGARTRKVLVKRIKELIDRGKFVFLEARIFGEEFLDKSKEKVEEVASKVRTVK
ncbi:MAG: YtxH domain-containing protein [Actinobacteria bacterium]|nr:YtxH domain-containing protein [Actinomycetota bacterium]